MLVQLINYVIMFSVTFMKKCMQMGTFGPGPNVAATFGPVVAIFGPTGQNMDAIFGPIPDRIWMRYLVLGRT